MLPTQEELNAYVDAYVEAVTDYIQGVGDHLGEIYGRLASDVERHLPGVTVPGLGSFEIPAPQPALELTANTEPLSWYQLGFIEDERTRRRVMIAGVASLGLGLGWGTWSYLRSRNMKRKRKESLDKSKLRREVVVVLGGDTIAGPALVHSLEKRGYVVITSVSTPDAVDQLEKKSKGNVKALVLNPKEPASVPYFHRSLNAALSLRFPLNQPGDPYLPSGSSTSSSTPTTNVLVSCISLLSINPLPTPIPLERLNLSSEYLSLMYETQITPLAAIQGILPLFRIATGRQGVGQTRARYSTARTSVVVLVPAVASRVGVAFDGARAMAIGGLVKGVEVMRREIGSDTNVILVDVGAIVDPEKDKSSQKESDADLDIIALTKAWSASERRAYGPAYEAALVHSSATNHSQTLSQRRKHHPRRRTPTDVEGLVSTIIPLIHFTRSSRSPWHPLYIFTHLSKSWHRLSLYLQGYRISVGAGARTYTLASLLPIWLLDTILDLPATLVSWKHKATPTPLLESRANASQVDPSTSRTQRATKPLKMIEAEERVFSTAPASTASGGSRRESIGSFEGVSLGVDSGDEAHKAQRREGTAGTIIAFDKQQRDVSEEEEDTLKDDVRSPSEGHVRTPSLGSGHLPDQAFPRSGASEQGDRIADSWVSLSGS